MISQEDVVRAKNIEQALSKYKNLKWAKVYPPDSSEPWVFWIEGTLRLEDNRVITKRVGIAGEMLKHSSLGLEWMVDEMVSTVLESIKIMLGEKSR